MTGHDDAIVSEPTQLIQNLGAILVRQDRPFVPIGRSMAASVVEETLFVDCPRPRRRPKAIGRDDLQRYLRKAFSPASPATLLVLEDGIFSGIILEKADDLLVILDGYDGWFGWSLINAERTAVIEAVESDFWFFSNRAALGKTPRAG